MWDIDRKENEHKQNCKLKVKPESLSFSAHAFSDHKQIQQFGGIPIRADQNKEQLHKIMASL